MWNGWRRILLPRFAPKLAEWLREWLERPLGRLTSHFLTRLARAGAGNQSSEFELGLGGLLGLLAAPGALNCFLLLDKYSSFLNWLRGVKPDPLLTSVPDKYFYIVLAMAVCGIMTVLKWDKILPDSQDYLNLAPLPIQARTVFLANAAAIVIAVVVIAMDVNLIPSLLFPTFVAASGHMTAATTLAFIGIHALCVVLASLFAVCGVFAVMGTLAAVLPRGVFRASASWVRGGLLLAFLALLFTGFAGSALVRQLNRVPDSPLRWLPPLWYLGLYQSLQDRATPALANLVSFAWKGSAAASGVMVLSYALSYRRRFAAVLEQGQKPSARRVSAAGLAILDLFAYRAAGFPHACHRFVVRALVRSETHRLVIAVSIGLGWLMALPSGSVEAAPLICAYLLILGLRVAFELPAALPANWIFRGILDPQEHDTAPVARRVMLSFLTPLVLLPCLAAAWWQWGWPAAAIHTLYVLAFSWILMEIQLTGYRKLPLTCPMPGFRNDFLMLCLLQLVGFLLFTKIGVAMERWMFRLPLRFLLVPCGMLAVWYWNHRRMTGAREAGVLVRGLVFENEPIRTVEQLNL